MGIKMFKYVFQILTFCSSFTPHDRYVVIILLVAKSDLKILSLLLFLLGITP